jgi:hypothetical protein
MGLLTLLRQQSLDNAHLKMQQEMLAWQKQKYEESSAQAPVQDMLKSMPDAAGAIAPAFPEATQYANNPSAYQYQPAVRGVPSESVPPRFTDEEAPGPQDGTPGQLDPSALRRAALSASSREDFGMPSSDVQSGPQAWGSRLGDIGTEARGLHMSAEVEKLKRALQLAQGKFDYSHNPDKLEEIAASRARGSLEGRNTPVNGVPLSSTDALNKATGSGTAKLGLLPEELELRNKSAIDRAKALAPTQVDVAGQKAAASAEAKAGTLKPVDSKTRESLVALKTYRDKLLSLKNGIESGDFPETGSGISKINSAAEKLGGYLPGNPTLNDPRVTARDKFLSEMMLDIERAKGGVRMAGSPVMLEQAKKIWANPENSPGGLHSRVLQQLAVAEKVLNDEFGGLKASNLDTSNLDMTPTTLSPEDIMGGQGGGKQGIWKMLPGSGPFGGKKKGKGSGGATRSPATSGPRTLTPDEIEALR